MSGDGGGIGFSDTSRPELRRYAARISRAWRDGRHDNLGPRFNQHISFVLSAKFGVIAGCGSSRGTGRKTGRGFVNVFRDEQDFGCVAGRHDFGDGAGIFAGSWCIPSHWRSPSIWSRGSRKRLRRRPPRRRPDPSRSGRCSPAPTPPMARTSSTDFASPATLSIRAIQPHRPEPLRRLRSTDRRGSRRLRFFVGAGGA